MQSKEEQLGTILAALDRHLQRATYAAVGGVVGLPAQSVMQGRSRTAMNAWVVSKRTRMPTGYAPAECRPRLMSNPYVIQTCEELSAWLDGHS